MTSLSYTLPTIGQPDSTEDPKIVTALSTIQSWANAGNGAILVPASASANATAVSGQAIRVTAAATITLPAHAVGQVVAIISQAGSGVVVSGTNIVGPGLSTATSFSLGSYGAFAVLHDNGTDWSFIAGQQDTGWVGLTLPGGIVAAGASTYAPAARLVGDRVWLRGGITNTSGSAITGIASVPASMTPASTPYLAAPSPSAGGTWTFHVTGTAVSMTPGLGASSSLVFDGLSYSLS